MKQIIIQLISVIAAFAIHVKAHSTFIPRSSQLQQIVNHDNDGNNNINNNIINKSNINTSIGTNRRRIIHDRMHVVQIPRGGSLTIDREEEESIGSNIVILKLRNIIRSIVEIGEKKSPITTKVLKLMIKCTEKITGLKLLPPKKKKKTKKQRRKKQEDDGEDMDIKMQTKKTSTKSSGDKQKKVKAQKKVQSKAAQSHLSKNIKTSNPNYRIQRELKEFLSSPPPNLSVKVGKNIRVWIIIMTGTKGSLYEGEKFRLKVTFPANYPTEPPSVYFLQPTPRHEHVYTNGDICLSLLGKDWRPTMTAQSLANSILSILSGASRKSLPMDNVAHAQNKPGGKQDDWIYHDDNC